jgi:molybdopterin-guanine dinucleotide biosynthesis protein A
MSDRVAAFVLAGGRSRRMGRDKALLEIAGEPIVLRTARLAQECAGTAAIIGPPERYAHLGYEVVPDRVAGAGPLGGIDTALSLGRAEWNLVLACDLAALDIEAVGGLLRRALLSAADCVVGRTDRPEPMFAVYSLRCRDPIRAALDAGVRKVAQALEPLDIEWHDVAVPHRLINLNSPRDLEAFLG